MLEGSASEYSSEATLCEVVSEGSRWEESLSAFLLGGG